jgi:hypothetical protein
VAAAHADRGVKEKTMTEGPTLAEMMAELDPYRREAIELNPQFLEEEFIRLPTDIALYSERYANALGVHLTAYARRKQVRAEMMIDGDFIEDLATKLGKKPNVDQIEAAIIASDRFKDAVAEERMRPRWSSRACAVSSRRSARSVTR